VLRRAIAGHGKHASAMTDHGTQSCASEPGSRRRAAARDGNKPAGHGRRRGRRGPRSRGADTGEACPRVCRGAVLGAAAAGALNAEYDALLAEFGVAPQGLDEGQVRAITEWRASELERLADIHARYGNSELWELEKDAAELARLGVDVRAISRASWPWSPASAQRTSSR